MTPAGEQSDSVEGFHATVKARFTWQEEARNVIFLLG